MPVAGGDPGRATRFAASGAIRADRRVVPGARLLAIASERAADLEAIRTLGFNSIRVAVEWADAEPARGQYRFDALDGMLDLAGQSGLKVMLQLSTASLPAWVLERYPDGRFVSKTQGGGPRTDRICLDASRRARRRRGVCRRRDGTRRPSRLILLMLAWHSIDLGSELQDGFCLCPHTAAPLSRVAESDDRFRRAERGALRQLIAATFVALERRDHLAAADGCGRRAGHTCLDERGRRAVGPSTARVSTSDRPGQDDWLMTTVVDHYGTFLPPQLSDGGVPDAGAVGVGARRPALGGSRQGLVGD